MYEQLSPLDRESICGALSGAANACSRCSGHGHIPHYGPCPDCCIIRQLMLDLRKGSAEPTGVQLIADERQRQVSKEGWTPEHDDTHIGGAMAITAACYAVHHTDAKVFIEGKDAFPWGSCYDKRDKHSNIRALTIAGALIAAEIDRIKRRDGTS